MKETVYISKMPVFFRSLTLAEIEFGPLLTKCFNTKQSWQVPISYFLFPNLLWPPVVSFLMCSNVNVASRGGPEEGNAQEMGNPQMGQPSWSGGVLPEIVIMKTEENQPSMENTCVKSGAIRFLSSKSASGESDFTIK